MLIKMDLVIHCLGKRVCWLIEDYIEGLLYSAVILKYLCL